MMLEILGHKWVEKKRKTLTKAEASVLLKGRRARLEVAFNRTSGQVELAAFRLLSDCCGEVGEPCDWDNCQISQVRCFSCKGPYLLNGTPFVGMPSLVMSSPNFFDDDYAKLIDALDDDAPYDALLLESELWGVYDEFMKTLRRERSNPASVTVKS